MGNNNSPQGNQMTGAGQTAQWHLPNGFVPPGNMPGMPNMPPSGSWGNKQGAGASAGESISPATPQINPAIAANAAMNKVQQAPPMPLSGGGRMLGGAVSPIAGMAGPGPGMQKPIGPQAAPPMRGLMVHPNAGRVAAQNGPISTRPVARPRRPMGGMV